MMAGAQLASSWLWLAACLRAILTCVSWQVGHVQQEQSADSVLAMLPAPPEPPDPEAPDGGPPLAGGSSASSEASLAPTHQLLVSKQATAERAGINYPCGHSRAWGASHPGNSLRQRSWPPVVVSVTSAGITGQQAARCAGPVWHSHTIWWAQPKSQPSSTRWLSCIRACTAGGP